MGHSLLVSNTGARAFKVNHPRPSRDRLLLGSSIVRTHQTLPLWSTAGSSSSSSSNNKNNNNNNNNKIVAFMMDQNPWKATRRPVGGPVAGHEEEEENFSFVCPLVKYLLFFFNMIFWMISMAMVAVGVYARLMKHAEAAVAWLAMDPAILFLGVGVLMFSITFCGCIGSLRENICLLQTFSVCLTVLFLLQLVAGALGFVFSDKVHRKVSEVVNNAIVRYRDDLDLQNLIDFGQKEFSCCGGISYKDWSQNMYFNCTSLNPSRERCSVPYSCCLQTNDQPVINTLCGQGMQALDYLEASEVIYTNGCIDKLVTWIHSNLFLLGGLALGLAIPQLVGILLSQVLVTQIRDQIKLQVYNQQHRADPWY